MGIISVCAMWGLYVINIVVFVAGLAIVGLASYFIYAMKSFEQYVEVPLLYPVCVLVAGLTLLPVAACGCYGAWNESKVFLIIFAACCAVLAGAQIYFTICALNGTVAKWIKDFVGEVFKNPKNKAGFNVVQEKLHCCGVDDYTSYPDPIHLPESCCAKPTGGYCNWNKDKIYKGCVPVITQFGDYISYISIGLVCLECLAITFALLRIYCGDGDYAGDDDD